MMPSMMVVKMQAANQLLKPSNEFGLHNEVSNNDSYAPESKWYDDASCTYEGMWSNEW